MRRLLCNRVAPLTQPLSTSADVEDGSASAGVVDRHRLDLPVYSKFLASCSQVHAAGDVVASHSIDLDNNHRHVCLETGAAAAGADTEHGDDVSTAAAAQSDCRSARQSSANSASDDVDDALSEVDVHSNSNYSIASSDTAALSIKLDENYDPVIETSVAEPKPAPLARVSTAKAVVRPLEARQSNIPVLRASASLPRNTVTSKSNSATQTSAVPPPLAYYHQQPFPYPVFGYGGFLPPVLPPLCETPIWPPYAYPPAPLPWYYGGPHYDPMQFMPAAPPYCVVPPSATTASHSQQSSGLPQQGETTTTQPGVGRQPAVSVESSQPTVVVLPPSSLYEPTAAAVAVAATHDKLFRPIATRSCFQPTAGSLFRPVTNSKNGGRRQISQSEPPVPADDEKLSRSLLEMVELITPQLDSCADSEEELAEDAEDEAEREAWEAEERERQRMRRRHTRQWMRALRTDVDQSQFSDTSL